MLQDIQQLALGSSGALELEHRCYNGVCLAAGFGCLSATVINTNIGIPLPITMANAVIGSLYLLLYFKSRRSDTYQPVLWLYILIGLILLVMTWFYNGGINGSDTIVSMVALVAMTVVLKTHRLLLTLTVFIPAMSALFLLEYLYPELIIGYDTIGHRFLDVYLTFLISTAVIFAIITLILQSHDNEKRQLGETNRLLKEKMELLNRTNSDLEKALVEVKTLSGLLPICATCKKIRDDKGYWNQIEGYIQKYSDAQFSHSVCPDCSKKLYPDFDL